MLGQRSWRNRNESDNKISTGDTAAGFIRLKNSRTGGLSRHLRGLHKVVTCEPLAKFITNPSAWRLAFL